ncbi:G patch domain and ankyrin repeat-containing protein 1 homolog [Stomoxys calcitrans]|uniref:G patch domain and ankyrin repeat-containing protein 1 homolog n=1 Tax=Stomoxys calcitrans TaxID=35570 RepID=UPI0027E2670D|nr:G patch domain and ankyrin repeat-containing protein 1 homolog [Stomoxys calcitrans]
MEENMGEQLHPNWRALSTIHIPIKRFIREGIYETHQGTHSSTSKERYQIEGVNGGEIKEFYESLTKTENRHVKEPKTKASPCYRPNSASRLSLRESFHINKYQRYALENNVEKLRQLNFEGQDVNACDAYGWTTLMMAACEGNVEAVKYLLQLGVDRDIKDKAGNMAKDLARKKGHFHIEQILETFWRHLDGSSTSSDEEGNQLEPFYCDICKRTFSETTRKCHLSSTVHQFNTKSSLGDNKLQKFNISTRNKGLQLMMKQGWDRESGLGPSQSGRLYPVKTVIRKQRTGLGIEQEPARVTHFQAFDKKAVQRQNSQYYKKKPRNRNDMRREKVREWKREKRLRNELN